MDKQQVYKITGVVIVLFLVGLSLIFEVRKVPNYDQKTRYDLEEKDPIDAFAFAQLLNQRFGEDNIKLKTDSIPLDSLSTGQLYVSIGSSIRYNPEDEANLLSFIRAGNDALLISKEISLDVPVKEVNTEWNDTGIEIEKDDAIAYEEAHDSISDLDPDLAENEMIFGEDDINEEEDEDDDDDDDNAEDKSVVSVVVADSTLDSGLIDTSWGTADLDWYLSDFTDTMLVFDFVLFDSTSTPTYSYKHYGSEFIKPTNNRFSYLYKGSFLERESFIYIKDSLDIYSKIKIGDGHLYVHTVPELFTNLATEQSFYLDHFNKVFSYFETNKVIINKPNPLSQIYNRKDSKSPLQYILSVPSLSWAYYLLVATLILFVIFRGKRTQRIIPTIPENKNTSMDYIKTLSILYQDQKQNSKLIKHMREGFYHRVKSKYFLDHKDEDFIEKLAAKSKIDLSDIENLIHKLKSTRGAEFTDDQLMTLHRQIESFYKKAA